MSKVSDELAKRMKRDNDAKEAQRAAARDAEKERQRREKNNGS